jgi:F0F1-type ATP synthase membrane subunit b/b'
MRSDCRSPRAPRCRARACAFAVVLLVGAIVSGISPLAQSPEAPAAQAAHAEDAPHGESLLRTGARLANFAILAGVLVYFLRAPLADIARKLDTLPAELAALKAQGAQDVVAEQARIAQAAALERERLVDQTRREIATRLRQARRELTAHAAELAIKVAEERIRRSITPEDQLRLMDRFTSQLSRGDHGIQGTEAR